MNTLTKLAWKKDLMAAGSGAAIGGLAGEVKHRRAKAKGKDSSRAANIAGGAVGGGALGFGGRKAYQKLKGGKGKGGITAKDVRRGPSKRDVKNKSRAAVADYFKDQPKGGPNPSMAESVFGQKI